MSDGTVKTVSGYQPGHRSKTLGDGLGSVPRVFSTVTRSSAVLMSHYLAALAGEGSVVSTVRSLC